jgi:S-DNA-T family DNA segregation ATPase FtsK/SpoIIIE
MRNDERKSVLYEQNAAYYFCCLKKGLRNIVHKPLNRVITILYWVVVVLLILKCSLPPDNQLEKLLQPILLIGLIIGSITFFLLLVIASAIPAGAYSFANAFRSINLVNSAGQPPLLADIIKYGDKMVAELFTQGISIEEITKRKLDIEAALNKRIVSIKEGSDCQHINMYLAPGTAKLPEKITLPENVDNNSNNPNIVLGQSLFEDVIVNLNSTPHILVGGSTGSGKTTMLKVIIQQALQKGWVINLIDMKGGIDYPPKWHKACGLCTEEQSARDTLRELVTELESRKKQFSQISKRFGVACSSIADFNLLCSEKSLPRILIIIDELAELTDKNGMDKAHKEQADQIVNQLATIARLGRAYGINLIIGVQRGDAVVVPGQIKSNITYRISGKADATLSMIILDNTSANEMIPKDSRGRFINHDGVVFHGYIIND